MPVITAYTQYKGVAWPEPISSSLPPLCQLSRTGALTSLARVVLALDVAGRAAAHGAMLFGLADGVLAARVRSADGQTAAAPTVLVLRALRVDGALWLGHHGRDAEAGLVEQHVGRTATDHGAERRRVLDGAQLAAAARTVRQTRVLAALRDARQAQPAVRVHHTHRLRHTRLVCNTCGRETVIRRTQHHRGVIPLLCTESIACNKMSTSEPPKLFDAKWFAVVCES